MRQDGDEGDQNLVADKTVERLVDEDEQGIISVAVPGTSDQPAQTESLRQPEDKAISGSDTCIPVDISEDTELDSRGHQLVATSTLSEKLHDLDPNENFSYLTPPSIQPVGFRCSTPPHHKPQVRASESTTSRSLCLASEPSSQSYTNVLFIQLASPPKFPTKSSRSRKSKSTTRAQKTNTSEKPIHVDENEEDEESWLGKLPPLPRPTTPEPPLSHAIGRRSKNNLQRFFTTRHIILLVTAALIVIIILATVLSIELTRK